MKEEQELFKGFEQMWQATQVLQKAIGYSFVEALGETLQNLVQDETVQQVDGEPSDEIVKELKALYNALQINNYQADDIRKMIQYTFLKAAKEDQLQQNHQMTPDAIALLLAFMVDKLTDGKESIRLGDLSAGTGNLLSAVMLFLKQSKKQSVAIAIDNDEVLTHLGSQATALEHLPVEWFLQDAMQEMNIQPLDIAISDLPVGYYPLDEVAKNYQTKLLEGHSYAHHLLIEQHINQLAKAGIGIFMVPTNIFEEEYHPSGLLDHLEKETHIQAILALPKNLFKKEIHSKSILIVQKKGNNAKQVSQVLLGDIPEFKNIDKFMKFTTIFEKWSKELVQ